MQDKEGQFHPNAWRVPVYHPLATAVGENEVGLNTVEDDPQRDKSQYHVAHDFQEFYCCLVHNEKY